MLLILSGGMKSASAKEAVSCHKDYLRKITFDINKINDDGLTGPPEGLVSVDYEFCIPAGKDYAEEVKRIDPSAVIHESSSGRIGCSPEEYLCIGNTHQKDFRAVLCRLAGLTYVRRIDMCFWE